MNGSKIWNRTDKQKGWHIMDKMEQMEQNGWNVTDGTEWMEWNGWNRMDGMEWSVMYGMEWNVTTVFSDSDKIKVH